MSSLGVYLHYPYCISKCPYCDFNSFALSEAKREDAEKKYIEAMCLDLQNQVAQYSLAGRECSSIFFGGGTPSLMKEESFDALMCAISKELRVLPNTEVTLEANPASLSEVMKSSKLKSFMTSGLNRVSFGIQSFNPKKLQFLGRWHTNEDSKKSISLVRDVGIDNINMDLMYGIVGETADDLLQDISTYVQFDPTHISAYMLTVEPNTEFGKRARRGETFTIPDDLLGDLYVLSQQKLSEAGFSQYEVSNFSRSEDTQCQHNLGYWRGAEYLGIGAGAHGFYDSSIRRSSLKPPVQYVTGVFESGSAIDIFEELTLEDMFIETLATQLRLSEGVIFSRLPKVIQDMLEVKIHTPIWRNSVQEGKLIVHSDGIRIDMDNFVMADYIIGELIE